MKQLQTIFQTDLSPLTLLILIYEKDCYKLKNKN